MARYSQVLLNGLLEADSLKSLMGSFKLDIYTGAIPTKPEDAASGTKLATIVSDQATSAALTFGNVAAGKLLKNEAELWQAIASAAGVAGWFRIYKVGEDPAPASGTAMRVDGVIATSGGDCTVASTTIALNQPLVMTSFYVAAPGSV